jgi:hypothetical protein
MLANPSKKQDGKIAERLENTAGSNIPTPSNILPFLRDLMHVAMWSPFSQAISCSAPCMKWMDGLVDSAYRPSYSVARQPARLTTNHGTLLQRGVLCFLYPLHSRAANGPTCSPHRPIKHVVKWASMDAWDGHGMSCRIINVCCCFFLGNSRALVPCSRVHCRASCWTMAPPLGCLYHATCGLPGQRGQARRGREANGQAALGR